MQTISIYIHIPLCVKKCAYCDFASFAGRMPQRDAYTHAVCCELRTQAAFFGRRRIATVFFGGGTPTLLPAEDLAGILKSAIGAWGLVPGAEVTTEANPDSVTPESLQLLADAGFTRVSFGMQSAVPHVLAVLDRTHTPSRVPQAVKWARDAGLHVSVDLIYGTPGESMADWKTSLEEALSYEPDHISAYALIIEEGTKLAARMRRGEVPPIDDDDHADKYVLADEMMSAAGLSWYEVSNWARTPADQCRHNLAYWRSDDWWGIGPGAHSHAGGVRWWNAKHPTAYAQRIGAGESPAVGRETLDADTRYVEDIMLRTRLAEGLDLSRLREPGRLAVAGLMADGLVDPRAALTGRVILTGRGRLLADAVVRRLLPD